MRDKRRFLSIIIISVIIFLGISFYYNISLKAEEQASEESGENEFEQDSWFGFEIPPEQNIKGATTFGIKDPDGKKSVWALSKYGAKNMQHIVADYPSQFSDGINFYTISSWEDTGRAVKASYEDRDNMIWTLYYEISSLKLRVKELEGKLSLLTKEENKEKNSKP